MAHVTEARHRSEALVSEANGGRSRDEVTLDSTAGVTHLANTVMGIITATGEWVEWKPASGDGSEDAAGVLYEDNTVVITVDKQATMFVRDCEFNQGELLFEPSSTATAAEIVAAIAELAALGIIVRTGL